MPSPMGRSAGCSTELSLTSVFVVAMRPPPVGTAVTIRFYLPGVDEPVPPLEARVTTVVVDPADAEQTGFDATFAVVNETATKTVVQAIQAPGPSRQASVAPPGHGHSFGKESFGAIERRRQPRVWTDLIASFGVGDNTMHHVRNVSMSGALVELRPDEPDVAIGTLLVLHILKPDAPEGLTVVAQVARTTAPGEPRGIGVHFLDVDEQTAARLEGLIMHALAVLR